MNICAKYITPIIWMKYGFFNAFMMSFGIECLSMISILISINYFPLLFTLNSLISNYSFSMSNMFSYLVIFNLYPPQIGIHLAKAHDINFLIALFYSMTLNKLFFTVDNISLIFFIFLIGNLMAMIYFFMNFRNKQPEY